MSKIKKEEVVLVYVPSLNTTVYSNKLNLVKK